MTRKADLDSPPMVERVLARQDPEPGLRTHVSPKSDSNLPTDLDREKERVLPVPESTGGGGGSGGGTQFIPQVQTVKPQNGISDRPRTIGQPGEERGVPVKEDYGYPTRRSMTASVERVVEAYHKTWSPGHRQRRQRGPAKQRTRNYYRKNRNRIKARARVRYQRARHNPTFQRVQRHRRKHPSQHRRLHACEQVVADLFLAASEHASVETVATVFLMEAYKAPKRIPPAKRQKRQTGPEKMESHREYVRDRPRKNREMKRRHKVLMRNQQFRNYKKYYNDEYRARGETRFRRRADEIPVVPEIEFVIGTEMAEGMVRSLSQTGMVTFMIADYESVLLMPFTAFVESVVFLSDNDLNAFFGWADSVLGPEAYRSFDEDALWECASLFEIDPDSDEFRDKCQGLVGESDYARMTTDQLEAVNDVLVTKTAEGITFTFERESPSQQVKYPGQDIDYTPTTEGLPRPGDPGPDKHEDDFDPGSSRVVPRTLAARVASRWLAAASIADINAKADGVSHSRATKVGPVKIVRADPGAGLWVFSVVSANGNKVYTVKLKGLRKGNARDIAKLDVRISCSCPAFRWLGPEHWAKVEGYQQGKPQGTASFPVIKDPEHKHPACKHVLAVFKHMPQVFLDPPTPR